MVTDVAGNTRYVNDLSAGQTLIYDNQVSPAGSVAFGTAGDDAWTDRGNAAASTTADGRSNDSVFTLVASGLDEAGAGAAVQWQVKVPAATSYVSAGFSGVTLSGEGSPALAVTLGAQGAYSFRAVVTDSAGNTAYVANDAVGKTLVYDTEVSAGALLLQGYSDYGNAQAGSTADRRSNDSVFSLVASELEADTTVQWEVKRGSESWSSDFTGLGATLGGGQS
ncbi:MAG: hypothetical protein EBT33_22385, partial [Betaproteobacteria bacterium]|nr:hypothetical protein [Betaproteobacteria bacterium]